MANLLIFSKELPYPLHTGNAVRVYNPCRELAREHACYLVTFGEPGMHVEALERQGVFREIHLIRQPVQSLSIWRHLRWSNKNFIKLSMPEFYHNTVQFLKKFIQLHQIEAVVVFPDILTEFVEPLQNIKKIADNCDSTTLTYERFYKHRKSRLSPKQKLVTWLTLQRYRNFERLMPDKHDYVVSISPADLNKLKELNPQAAYKVKLIPNGVPAEILAYRTEPEIENAIIFWGNLDFPPNYTAIHYFYKNVYRPYLASHNIKWFIVGKSADKRILAMAETDTNIVVTGFVENLYDFAVRIPIVINPMLIGSGMKNKVLEAFALHRMVVSNALGVEAIVGAQPGVHYLQAQQPEEFADAILNYMHCPLQRKAFGANARKLVEERYTWDKIGKEWLGLINDITTAPGMTAGSIKKEVVAG